MTHTRKPRLGFTLTELLVAIVVIGILGAMTMIGLNAAQQSARLAQTRGLVSRINEVIMNHWDDYHFRVFSVQYPPPPFDIATAETIPQVLSEEAARARLMMVRDLMRMELPDRITDLFVVDPMTQGPTNNPTNRQLATRITVIATSYFEDTSGQLVPGNRIQTPILWPPASSLTTYQEQAIALTQSPNASGWSPQHESAECLYLILSNLTLNGMPAMEMIAPFNMDDVDNDGMPEIIDAWGNPIAFVRWPSGMQHSSIDITSQDEFDIVSSDWSWSYDRTASPATPYSIRPLIVSPGLDGELGINLALPPGTAPYHQMLWPRDITHGEIAANQLFFIDPFIRYRNGNSNQTISMMEKPGAITNRDLAADNITSFDL